MNISKPDSIIRPTAGPGMSFFLRQRLGLNPLRDGLDACLGVHGIAGEGRLALQEGGSLYGAQEPAEGLCERAHLTVGGVFADRAVRQLHRARRCRPAAERSYSYLVSCIRREKSEVGLALISKEVYFASEMVRWLAQGGLGSSMRGGLWPV